VSPLVSVVVPTHYRNDRLETAIDSVLDQTHEEVELIVVDDSGESHARPVVDSYATNELTYISLSENRGGNMARNAGIERANGAFVALLDDDDWFHETRLERGVAQLQEADVGVSYCGRVFENGRTLCPRPGRTGVVLDRALAFDIAPCVTSTMLMSSTVLDNVTPLADRPGGDDLGLMIELACRTRFTASMNR
jgi:glycosyltransferase involved in cell wall biosynthesis